MHKPKKRARRKKPTLVQRETLLDEQIDVAFEGVTSAAHFKHLAEVLMGKAVAMLSIAEGKADGCEPLIIWDDDPLAALHATVGACAEFTKTPLDQLVGEIIGRMPAGTRFYWN